MNAQLGGKYAKIVNAMTSPGLVGFVDMHTHLAAQLGFGRELFYGAPDGDPARVLNNCNQFHGGLGIDNLRGNEFRRILVDEIRKQKGAPEWDHKREGWPDFPAWPTWHDRFHQQMRVEWLERAWRGGLRVIVALAVNSHTLADGGETQGPYDDLSSGDAQIREIHAVAERNRFMQVVRQPSELREVVGNGRLAVVVGCELDCIGNFYRPFNTHHSAAAYRPHPSAAEVQQEIQRLYELGVRYLFLIHVTDNLFGGAAVYERGFDTAIPVRSVVPSRARAGGLADRLHTRYQPIIPRPACASSDAGIRPVP